MRLLFIILLCSLGCCPLAAQQPKLMLPIGHTATIIDASFSPDEKKIITASYDKTAKIWGCRNRCAAGQPERTHRDR
jgi:WD40 repeat protein